MEIYSRGKRGAEDEVSFICTLGRGWKWVLTVTRRQAWLSTIPARTDCIEVRVRGNGEKKNRFPYWQQTQFRPSSRHYNDWAIPASYSKYEGIRFIQNFGRPRSKCEGTRAETRFRLSAKQTIPFKSAGGRQFSQLLAAEMCASAVVMLDTPCSEVVWRVLATHCIRQSI